MPNRIIKESICTSDDINGLSWLEEVFFYRLVVNCDDYGRMDARPAILKAKLFPLKDITAKQVESLLNKLSTAGMVRVYEYDRQPFLQLTAWEKHQQIRAKKSKYPAPGIAKHAPDNICNQMQSDAPVIQSESKPPKPPASGEAGRDFGETGGENGGGRLDGDEMFEKVYSIYPLKEGKTSGKKAFMGYLSDRGRGVKGQGTVRLNHYQIGFAASAYKASVEGKDPQYIKHFSTFMNGELLDWLEKSRGDYEGFMQGKYGGEWEKIRFEYNFV